MSISTTRLFNPLTGEDLRKIIKNEFNEKLEGSVLLQPHLTFPLVTYKIELTIESYPMNDAEIIRVEKIIGDPSTTGEPKIEKLTYSRTLGEDQETAPDKLREDNQIPVLQPEKDPNTGRMVDTPQKRRLKSIITVGKGTLPRTSAPKAPKVVPVETSIREDILLDDTGSPIKVNRF